MRLPRTSRVHLTVNVQVVGMDKFGTQFKEDTQSVLISAKGGLIELKTLVAKEQKLTVTNSKTGSEISCHVTTQQVGDNGREQIGVRFDEPSPHFWGLGFPPDDWNPDERKLPDPQSR